MMPRADPKPDRRRALELLAFCGATMSASSISDEE